MLPIFLTLYRALLIAPFICCIAFNSYAVDLPVPSGTTSDMPEFDKGYSGDFVYQEVQKPTEDDVPSVDSTQSPRMQFKGFIITGVIDRPELGITQAVVEEFANQEAFRLAPSEPPLGFTIDIFEQIATSITARYRSAGLFLARAYIPEQTVSDGYVRLHIIEGILDAVVFDGNDNYSSEYLSEPFKDLLQQPVEKIKIENQLYVINDLPGVRAKSVFGPGTKPATAVMLVNVDDKEYIGTLSYDNYGSVYTGENRVRLGYTTNNLWGQSERIDMNLLATLSPANSIFANIVYTQPVFDLSYRAGGGLSFNTFDIGQELEPLGITGDSSIIHGFMSKQFFHNSSERLIVTTDFSLKSSTSSGGNAAEDKLTVLRAGVLYSNKHYFLRPATQEFTASFSLGLADLLGAMDAEGGGNGKSSRKGGSGALAGGDFTKINLGYKRYIKVNRLQSALFRFNTQMSSDLLTSLEQFSLGGPETVRNYPVAEALVDSATFFSLEWIAKASPDIKHNEYLNNLKMSVFFDYASGTINDPDINELESVSLAGIGVGIEVQPVKDVKARIDLAIADLGDTPSDNRSLPFYFHLEYAF